MLNKDSIVFGEKEKFAIEVSPYKIPKKFYIRLWFENAQVGNFKRGGSLDYIINSYFKILKNLNLLYENKFDHMSDRQIFDDIMYDLTVDRTHEEESMLFARQQMFCFEFGDNQFNDFTFIVLYSEKEITVKILIYEMDGKAPPKLHSFNIQSIYFFSIFKKFVRFAFDNGMKKNEPFFPDGFSYEDLK